MRTRRFANNERIRSKERRLQPVLIRQEAARLYSTLPKGVIGALSHTTTVGGTTSTINTPLLALVETASETWQVDFAAVPDSTGGFADITIEAGKQIGELAANAVITLTGQSVGNYVVYAQHSRVNENAETRQPPGKYAGGTGVFGEHRDFFGHGKSDGEPIPREGYDSTLSAETVSEAVDRLTIGFSAENSVPSDATPLLRIVWDGSAIAGVTDISRSIDLTALYSHVGAGGSAHAVATTTTAGFMSSADKTKLDNATSDFTPERLAQRDSAGRLRVTNPGHDADAMNRGSTITAITGAIQTARSEMMGNNSANFIYGSVSSGGVVTAPSAFNLSCTKDISTYTVTHGIGHSQYVVLATATAVDRTISGISKLNNSVSISVTSISGDIVSPTSGFDFVIIVWPNI